MRSIEEIYEELVGLFGERTGLSPGEDSDLAVRFYAVAAELYSLYVQANWTREQCFPQTAAGEYLDRHAALRGLARRQADQAQGVIRFYVDQAREDEVKVDGGTVCMTAGQVRFETTETGTIPAGTLYVDVPAQAVEPGESGNAAAGTILTMAVAPTAVSACVNPEPFSGGRDEEDDESLRSRVLESFQRLANGANAAYYRQTAMSFDDVVAAQVTPRSRGVGTVDVTVATQAGVPDQELLDQIQTYIQSMREIAVDVEVLAPETETVNVALSVEPAEGCDAAQVKAQVEDAVRGWFTGERLGQSVLRAQLTALVFGLDGVANCTVVQPTKDVTLTNIQLPVLGSCSVSMSA
jgi:uncharacterized phage protein gp47/JayE